MIQSSPLLARPLVRVTALVAVAALLLLLGPQAFQARATTCGSVASEAAFRACITALSADSSGPHTIVITGSFEFDDASPTGTPTYTGSQDLTIETDGPAYSVSKHVDAGTTQFLLFEPTTSDVSLTINDLSITHFNTGTALVSIRGSVALNDVTLAYNEAGSANAGGGLFAVNAPEVTIDGSTFVGNTSDWGGGMYVEAINGLSISNTSIVDNTATHEGGGIFVYETDVTLSSTIFSDNTAGSNGGGLYVEADEGTWSVSVTDSTIVSNTANNGGGIFAERAAVDLFDVDVLSNEAAIYGGGVYVNDGSLEATEGGFYYNQSNDSEVTAGGGAFVQGINATLTDTAVIGNSADFGGGLYFETGTVDISGTDLVANEAFQDGGALFAVDSEVTVTASQFVSNDANTYGGAIYIESFDDDATVTIGDNTLMVDNTADYGGGVFADSADVDVSESTVIASQALAGAGLYVEQASLTMVDVEMNANTAQIAGGAIVLEDSEAAIESSLLLSNSGVLAGGALYIVDSDAVVTNTTILANSSPYGGGVYVEGTGSHLDLIHVTAYANTGTTSGSHVYLDNGTTLTSFGTLYAAHSGSDACQVASGTVVSLGYNYSMTASCPSSHASDTVGPHPDDLSYGSHGGSTSNFKPNNTNPLVDAIPFAQCYPGVDYDQRGASRAQDGNGDGIIACDIGSVELEGELLHFSVNTAGGLVSGTVRNLDGNPLWAVTDVEAKASGSHGQPAGIMTPYGLIAFVVELTEDGDSVEIVLTLPAPVKKLWKVDGTVWTEVTTATFAGTTVTYVITDGGFGDHDGSANSRIVDPVAPGLEVLFTG